VVPIVRVAVTAEGPDRVTEEGDMLQDIPPKLVLQVRATVPVNPPKGVKVIVDVADCPAAEMLTLGGLNARLKSVTLIVEAAEVEAA
jgi:hypothetical protein